LNAPLAAAWQSPSRMTASVFFASDSSALSSLVEFADRGRSYSSEMELLSAFAREEPSILGSLPTLDRIVSGRVHENSYADEPLWSLGQIYDPARLGMFAFGTDPRNTSKFLIRGGFENLGFDDAEEECGVASEWFRVLAESRLSISEGKAMLRSSEVGDWRISNLHVHSKIHRRLLKTAALEWLELHGHRSPQTFGLNWLALRNALAATVRDRRLGATIRSFRRS